MQIQMKLKLQLDESKRMQFLFGKNENEKKRKKIGRSEILNAVFINFENLNTSFLFYFEILKYGK